MPFAIAISSCKWSTAGCAWWNRKRCFAGGRRMSRQITCEVLLDCLSAHPAVQAWSRLESSGAEPRAVEVLQSRRKTAVYRLAGVGPEGSAIIAKRCRRTSGSVERMIYQECLTGLPGMTPECYGFVEDPADGEFGWLFLEDAGGQTYSLQNAEHRRAPARWIGAVHTVPIAEALARRLPERGLGHYRQLLRSAREAVVRHLTNPEVPPEALETLESAASQLDLLESHWPQVEGFVAGIPPAPVHGDLAIKNVGLRCGSAGLSLLVFDWENGGWGLPAVDLCQFNGHTLSPDLETRSEERRVGKECRSRW